MKIRFLIQYLLVFFLTNLLLFTVAFAKELPEGMSPEINILLEAAREAKEHSGTGALILKKEGIFTVEDNGYARKILHVIIQIHDEKAASDYGQIVIYYNSYYEEITLDFARTRGKDGRILEVSKDAVQTKTLPNLYGARSYSDIRALTFSLKGLEPGVVFEYKATLTVKPIVKNTWSDSFQFNYVLLSMSPQRIPRIDPVLKSRYILNTLPKKPFETHLNFSDVEPTVTKSVDALQYCWEANGIPALSLEKNMPTIEKLLPSIELTSCRSWKVIDAWAWELFQPNMEPDKDIIKTAAEITSGINEEDEKIRALFNFIQKNIEYTMADLGRGGYKPHPAGQILKSRYGDCKDQTTLFIALLKAVGINAFPALMNPYPRKDTNRKIPSADFSHVIVNIPSSKDDLWLDTTGITKYPDLLWHNQGRLAFVLNGKGGQFKHTPESEVGHNKASMKFLFFREDNVSISELHVICEGAISDNLKQAFRVMQSDHRNNLIRDWHKALYPQYEMKSINFSDSADPNLPLKITGRFECHSKMEDDIEYYPCSASFATVLNFFTGLYSLTPPHERKTDYMIGFKHSLKGEWVFSPPDSGYSIYKLPDEASISSDFIKYNISAGRKGENVMVTSNLTLHKDLISTKEYTAFYGDIQDMIKESEKKILFKKCRVDNKAVKLMEEVNSAPKDTENLLALAKHYLKTGKYSEAKELLQEAITIDAKSGEVHYFLGITFGYNDQFDEAEKQFEKAAAFGYIP